MVRLHVKRADESQFLYETTTQEPLSEVIKDLVQIYNGRLKIGRLFHELETLGKHGISLPQNMQGLTEEQIRELKLEDPYLKSCSPSGGEVQCEDPVGRRCGRAPTLKMQEVLEKTRNEAKGQVAKELVQANKCLTMSDVRDALDKMRGAVMIVYPMNLPPHDPIRMEFEGTEDLSGTQASKEVIEENSGSLWWSGKELLPTKKLVDYIGKNEKTKIIVKLQKKGQSAPSREPVVSAEEQKQMMLHYHRKQEELKKLENDEEDAYMNSSWADNGQLRNQFHGLSNIRWRP